MKRRIKLTKTAIDGLRAPDPSGKQTLHWDSELIGFGVLCSGVTTSRSYIVQRDLPSGKTRRLTVAAVAELPLNEARQHAARLLNDLRNGVDPKAKIAIDTLHGTLEGYLAARKGLRPATVRVYRQIERYLADWMDLPLRDISGDMVEKRHRSLATEIGTTTANLTLRVLRVLWNFQAERTPGMPPNPVLRLRRQWFEEPRRERIIGSADLPKFYQSVCALKNPIARDFVLLLMFTGMRRGEAARLLWEDVDFVQRIIRLPAASTKSKRKVELPMSDYVRALLVARRSLGDSGYVFPGKGAKDHIKDLTFTMGTVAATCGITVSAHDLRRTFITIAESADISVMALKTMVGHSLGRDITFGYVQMTTERLREPVQRVCNKIKELCGIEPVEADNVAKLV
jgi:integrase